MNAFRWLHGRFVPQKMAFPSRKLQQQIRSNVKIRVRIRVRQPYYSMTRPIESKGTCTSADKPCGHKLRTGVTHRDFPPEYTNE